MTTSTNPEFKSPSVSADSLHLSLIDDDRALSPTAHSMHALEMESPIEVSIDSSLRIKMLDQCGMACTFCHNEGTPVTADNRGKLSGEYTDAGKSNRVSIFLSTNGAQFVSGAIQPNQAFNSALEQVDSSVAFDEVHLTGGEPTLHPKLPEIVRSLKEQDKVVKITSNGERFYAVAPELKEAGLDKVVFSIFGTTAEELADVQGGKFKNIKFAQLKLDALERSLVAAYEHGIPTSANIVMPDRSHNERIKRIIERFGDICKIRILNSLDEGIESYEAIYELLAEINAVPTKRNVTAGASGMSVDYLLPDGKEIGFKQIRKSYLPDTCKSCHLKDNGCEEGFYGTRLYVDTDEQYHVGVCIQRMDLTRPVQEFVKSPVPVEISRHRLEDYVQIVNNMNND